MKIAITQKMGKALFVGSAFPQRIYRRFKMKMQEAEMWLKGIVPENMVFCLEFIRFHHADLSGNRTPENLVTECNVWLGSPIKEHIMDSNWKILVERIYQKFQEPKVTEIPDLGFGGLG